MFSPVSVFRFILNAISLFVRPMLTPGFRRRMICAWLVLVMCANPVLAMPGMPTLLLASGLTWYQDARLFLYARGWAAMFQTDWRWHPQATCHQTTGNTDRAQ